MGLLCDCTTSNFAKARLQLYCRCDGIHCLASRGVAAVAYFPRRFYSSHHTERDIIWLNYPFPAVTPSPHHTLRWLIDRDTPTRSIFSFYFNHHIWYYQILLLQSVKKEYEYECYTRPEGQIFAITHLPEYYMDEFVLLGKCMYLYIECSLCLQTAEATAAVVCKYWRNVNIVLCFTWKIIPFSIFYFLFFYFLKPYLEDTTRPLGYCTMLILFSFIWLD